MVWFGRTQTVTAPPVPPSSAPMLPSLPQSAPLFTDDLFVASAPPPVRIVANGEARTGWSAAFDAACSILAAACRRLWLWTWRGINATLDALKSLGKTFAELLTSWRKVDKIVDTNVALQTRTDLLEGMINTAMQIGQTLAEAKRGLKLSPKDEAHFDSLWEHAQEQTDANIEAAAQRVAELRERWNNRNKVEV